jgi:hypothetical protein
MQEEGGERAQQGNGGNHAPAGQHGGRFEREAEAVELGAQAAVEQNHRQRKLADHIGGGEIVEMDAAQTLVARQHAHAEEHQQQRHAETGGHARGDDADKQQKGDDQEKSIDG